jgi:hypothetical protein
VLDDDWLVGSMGVSFTFNFSGILVFFGVEGLGLGSVVPSDSVLFGFLDYLIWISKYM